MKPRAVVIGIACVAGFVCAQLALRSVALREEIGKLFNCGELLALVDGHGIYQADLDRRDAESDYVAGIEEEARTGVEGEAGLFGLVAASAAQSRASVETISRSQLNAEFNSLRYQFADDKTWRAVLNKSGLSPMSVKRLLKNNLRIRRWFTQRIAPQISVTDEECRQFYVSHRDQFFLLERRNVSHLFLAAPPETPPDVVEAKRTAIGLLAARLAVGEDFATLVAQNSEDEATKLNGGELGYFSARRMPPDFVEAAVKMHPGEISKPVRTRLGFHILKLIDVQAPRQQTLEEVRGDIAMELANEKRAVAVEKLTADLRRNAGYLRPF